MRRFGCRWSLALLGCLLGVLCRCGSWMSLCLVFVVVPVLCLPLFLESYFSLSPVLSPPLSTTSTLTIICCCCAGFPLSSPPFCCVVGVLLLLLCCCVCSPLLSRGSPFSLIGFVSGSLALSHHLCVSSSLSWVGATVTVSMGFLVWVFCFLWINDASPSYLLQFGLWCQGNCCASSAWLWLWRGGGYHPWNLRVKVLRS